VGKYIENQSFFAHHWPDNQKYMRFANKDYLEVAADVGFVGKAEPIVMQIYSEPLQNSVSQDRVCMMVRSRTTRRPNA